MSCISNMMMSLANVCCSSSPLQQYWAHIKRFYNLCFTQFDKNKVHKEQTDNVICSVEAHQEKLSKLTIKYYFSEFYLNLMTIPYLYLPTYTLSLLFFSLNNFTL